MAMPSASQQICTDIQSQENAAPGRWQITCSSLGADVGANNSIHLVLTFTEPESTLQSAANRRSTVTGTAMFRPCSQPRREHRRAPQHTEPFGSLDQYPCAQLTYAANEWHLRQRSQDTSHDRRPTHAIVRHASAVAMVLRRSSTDVNAPAATTLPWTCHRI